MRLLPLCVLTILLAAATETRAQIFKLEELNTRQIAALDRARTVVILVGGLLEEHGPYLPSGNDRYMAEWQAREVAEAIAARSGWTALLVPTIPLGVQGANDIGGKFSFPGSYTVSLTTLRAVYMDLADALGEDGFRWVFTIDAHAGPLNSRALDDAAEYFSDTFNARMVNLSGLMPYRQAFMSEMPDARGRGEEGFTVHGGASEHSITLFLRPDLVEPDVASAPAVTGKDFPDLVRLARATGWPGYFGAPNYASAAWGAQIMNASAAALKDLVTSILDGADPASIPRYLAFINKDPAVRQVNEAALAYQAERRKRHDAWLAKRPQ